MFQIRDVPHSRLSTINRTRLPRPAPSTLVCHIPKRSPPSSRLASTPDEENPAGDKQVTRGKVEHTIDNFATDDIQCMEADFARVERQASNVAVLEAKLHNLEMEARALGDDIKTVEEMLGEAEHAMAIARIKSYDPSKESKSYPGPYTLCGGLKRS
ncbi:hypothetical protein BD410DRAFT_783176 [Rickenella mellea]|uniref:Uncharacterized protein n=1 Tax=Rickenella mellea TaxID=50990 RepID=A0A4Y7QJG0_9AGAM|nr:hypothetical protein BD410DRAFT_783176 [Rickenella mellea]